MKANELRIGNWIFDAGDEQKNFQIEQICKDSDGFSGYYIVFRNGSFKSSVSSDLIEPIPLTPSVLESAGFTSHAIGYYHFGNFYISYANTSIHEFKFRDYPTFFKYLHQLQNLYFALTGTELEIDVSKIK